MLRLCVHGVAWAALIGPAFVSLVITAAAWASESRASASHFASLAVLGVILIAPITVPCGVAGAALAAVIGTKKRVAWNTRQWVLAGALGGSIIGVGASLLNALLESGGEWLFVLEKGYWFSPLFLISGGAVGAAFCRASRGSLEEFTTIETGV